MAGLDTDVVAASSAADTAVGGGARCASPFLNAKLAAQAINRDQNATEAFIPAVHGDNSTRSSSLGPPDRLAAAAQAVASPATTKARRSGLRSRLLGCVCLQPQVQDAVSGNSSSGSGSGNAQCTNWGAPATTTKRSSSGGGGGSSSGGSSSGGSSGGGSSGGGSSAARGYAASSRASMSLASDLFKQPSVAFSDADWCDARSEFSTALSSAASDHAAKLEELSAMLREMSHATAATTATTSHTNTTNNSNIHIHAPGADACKALALAPTTPIPRSLCPSAAAAAAAGPHIPHPPLAFAPPGLVFGPVPAVTGFAAYWERDAARSTPYPTPADVMLGASSLVLKMHESIPGIWLQESEGRFSVTVKPRFMPSGLPRYTEDFDKSNATTPSWPMRRDLRLGSTSGQIYATACGQLIMRITTKPLFGRMPDFVMEEYCSLEEGGQIIVDRQCCLEPRTGNRCQQLLVGRRHAAPPKGHV